MTALAFYDSQNEIALLSNTFTNASGAIADPTTVSCTVTEPSGTAVIHTFSGAAPADIVKVTTGKYTLSVACAPSAAGVDGLWGGRWDGTGAVSDTQPVTWRVLPAGTSQLWYVGLEEMKDRLSITGSTDDSALQTAIAAATGWLNEYTGRHFNRVTETRTFVPESIYDLDTDDIVPGAPIAVSVDFDGDGIYEQSWVKDADYQLYLGRTRFNTGSTGVTRPYEKMRVITSGKTFPFLWPFAPLNRVQIATTWGWTALPWQVTEAARILAADEFKMKDAPFGIAGMGEMGIVRIASNPWLVENLRAFVKGKRKVGV